MSSVIGYKYLFGIHMGVARSADELVEISVGDKTAWRGSITSNGETTIDAAEIFGGEKGEGGIQGTLTTMFGGPTQTAPAALATVLQTPMPGFRRMFTVFFNGIVSMMNPYPKPWKFRVRRTHAGWDGSVWYPEKCRISLTRPVSAGESQGTSENVSIGQSETLQAVQTVPGGDVFTITLAPSAAGPVTSIDEVVFRFTQNVGTENSYTTEHYLTPGDYSFNATTNVITLNSTPTFDPAVMTWLGTTHEFRIAYTQNVTTVDPLGGLGDVLIQAMNPAHMIWECYTNREWGRGFPATVLDEDSFRAAADTLYAERFGLCLRWNRRDGIRAFVQGVLDHIGGVIYADRRTAKIKIKLIRNDYTRGEVPLFTHDTGLKAVTEATVSSGGAMVNEVRVTYRDPVTNEDRTVRANNIASVQAAGGVTNSVSKEYKGLPLGELASRVAKRDLRSMSPSIRRFNITLDRRGYSVTPGAVIRIIDPTRGIGDIVLRVGTIDYGSMGNGEIKVVGIQDVFGLPTRGAAVIGPPQWIPPSNRPCFGDSLAFELPYRSVYRALSAADLSFVTDDAGYLGTVAEEGQPLNTSYQVAVRNGAPTSDDNPPNNAYLCGLIATPPTEDLDFAYEVGLDAPVHRYRMQETAGYTADDTGSADQNATYSTTGITLNQPGFVVGGKSVAFGGSANPGRLVGSYNEYRSACSLMMFIRANTGGHGTDNICHLALKGNFYASDTVDFPIALVYVPSTRKVQLRLASGASFVAQATLESGALTHGADYLVHAVYRANGLCELFINGLRVASTTISFQISSTGSSWSFGYPNLTSVPASYAAFNGLIGEIAIFDKALTQERITAHQNAASAQAI